MLRHIHIRDFAIIDEVELELAPGMTVLTGETGAGKSILLDALGLCLGDRADTGAVPEHAQRSEIHVSFDVSANPGARDWLAEQALDAEDECVLRRVIQRGGRSQSWINGRPVPLQQLDELGARLIEVHGQHAHQSLMRTEVQRATLDAFAGHDGALARVRELHAEWRRIGDEIRQLEGGQGDYQDRLELLRYQVEELDALGLDADGIRELEQEQRRLAAAGDILAACQATLAELYDEEPSAQGLLGAAQRRLEPLLDADPALQEAHDLFTSAQVQLQEGCQGLRQFADHMEMDPERLAWVESRLGELTDLARKHRVEPEALPERREALRRELEDLENAESRLAELHARREATAEAYREAAASLSESRRAAADRLAGEVGSLMRELGMPGGELLVRVAHDPDARPTSHGLDDVRFEIRTNPDQRPGPLSKVASGGELSRIGLALEVATAHIGRIPSLVFDEADAGIGGGVAEVVGRKLRELGRQHQVLCITHLPQVAAQAHHQLQVEKRVTEGRTRTGVRRLEGDARTQELARMLGGVEITENTLNHAREMLERAG
ncbi:DNA repair protein RecN [Sediminicurvatus halobius]|uniref:DNA repair protein RecN n=1 Tax=Sediminicurvatus halobius TaxID=2182432 RepID=A0A2U2N4W7_9GAMM|nr:DNA repair protein RecN [Spiribacter halobius]PWG64241.1 DNA repair protein RecN [Spiribacter halobius]UEX79425.1 DNA repair protein RecN [Spiribacter halobius]